MKTLPRNAMNVLNLAHVSDLAISATDLVAIEHALASAMFHGEVSDLNSLNVWAGRFGIDCESDGSFSLADLADRLAFWAFAKAAA